MEQEKPKEKSVNAYSIVGVLAAIAVIIYIVMPKNTTSSTDKTTQPVEPSSSVQIPTENTITEQVVNPDESIIIDMEAGAFYYTPNEIRVKQGQKVVINFRAVDMMHDINIDKLNVDGPVIKSGESTTLEFVATKTGEFEYYCSVGQHRQNGQVGTLIVE